MATEEVTTLEAIKNRMFSFCFRHSVSVILDQRKEKCLSVWGLHPPFDCTGCGFLNEPTKALSFFDK